ncbi:MAG: DNA topoisomerase 3 [Marinospirillum sp.]|uniref:DNA topoisomerase 3 n=1 Tax=Marinospirillum sp. TaxID=2183934 RepID=UPI0019FD2529|nr:DNA topoisomerase 3 [Marinospirillum sp.]MBE0506273.1 DNA topoisomerase 3 [Marinospirillum sp.]
MELVIAEKPKMAKAIAKALGKAVFDREVGYYTSGNFYVVPLQGHILETLEPDEYDDRYKKWNVADLPIAPNPWKLKANKESRGAQKIKAIKMLAPKVSAIIHAGDPDNEGQLLVDEVIQHMSIKLPVKRVLCADLTSRAIQKSFEKLESNSDKKFRGMHDRALARQRGDWLLGMNLTRFYTVTGKQAGLDQVLSYGRVQTAVLGLVARRCLEIKNFKPHDYFDVRGCFDFNGKPFTAGWKPLDDTTTDFDTEGRLIKRSTAESLQQRLKGQPGVIARFDSSRKKKRQPLPYTLSELQGEGNRRFGLTMQETLEIAQQLYDQHELTTYPRSDVAHLPEDQHQDAPLILDVVAKNVPGLAEIASKANPSIKSHAWNTKKVKGHYGIIPTGKAASGVIAGLSREARGLYESICKRYLAQFYPEAEFDETQVEVRSPDDQGERFTVTGRVPVDKLSWEIVYGRGGESEEDEGESDKESQSNLPAMKIGDQVQVVDVLIQDKITKPPKPFTDDTLNKAMNNIHPYLTRDDLKKAMKDAGGIGTEATRGDIVDKLFKRKYFERKKKEIWTTALGEQYYSILPAEVSSPDMAGIFELSARAVEDGNLTVEAFEAKTLDFIRRQMEQRENLLSHIAGLEIVKKAAANKKPCENCNSPMDRRKGKSGYFWICAGCDSLYGDENGSPGSCFKGTLAEAHNKAKAQQKAADLKDAPTCEKCESPLRRIESKKKKGSFFFGCSNRECNRLYSDENGKPGACFSEAKK